MGVFEPFSIGKRNLQCKNNWQELDINTYRITKPTVLCFGGNGTLTTKSANAMCKAAQGLVGLKEPSAQEFATSKDVDFIGFAYGKFGDGDLGSSFLTHNERKQIVDNIFLPLCINEKGALLQPNEILKNFSKITFFTHCHGATETAIIVSRTHSAMVNLGIDIKTANDAISQMFAVSYAPFEECGVPSLQVVPMKDDVLIDGPDYCDISHRFLMDRFFGARNLGSGTVCYKEDEHTINLLVSDMTKSSTDEHGINVTKRDENWRYEPEDSVYGDEVSQAMGNALALSIANSLQNENSDALIPKPSIDEVLEETKSIIEETESTVFGDSIYQIKRDLGIKDNTSAISPTVNSTAQETTTFTPTELLPEPYPDFIPEP